MTLRVTPLVEKTFGAVIDGVDVRSLDETTWHGIESAFLEHGVIVLKGQSLGVEKQTAFARRFGELELRSDQTLNPDLEGRPIVFGISNVDADGNRIKDRDHPQTRYLGGNEGRHSDSSFIAVSAKASVLHAIEVPGTGGQTGYADARRGYDARGYDALTEAQKRELERERVFHSLRPADVMAADTERSS